MHRLVMGGCYDGLRIDTKTGFIVMWFEGGTNHVHRHPYCLHLLGGRLAFIVVHSQRLNPPSSTASTANAGRPRRKGAAPARDHAAPYAPIPPVARR
jgi:hypothetical protein